MLMFVAFITIWNMLRSHTKLSNIHCFIIAIIAIIAVTFTSICSIITYNIILS